jgi:Acetyltransferase (isoleucine patch superfamily)
MPTNTLKWGPAPTMPFPVSDQHRICYLKPVVTNPNIIIGDYTYYDDSDHPEWFEKNVLFHDEAIGDKLIIGKFCAISAGVTFIMNGANHQMSGFSTYPFGLFGHGWEQATPSQNDLASLSKGDTVIGNDVWIGREAVILPGVKVGDGAIIGAQSVVTHDVPPYSIIAGNPARFIRRRFDDETVYLLIKLRWWDWPSEKITENLNFLVNGDKKQLAQLTAEMK